MTPSNANERLEPAFRTKAGRCAFLGLSLFFLLLPFIPKPDGLIDRGSLYRPIGTDKHKTLLGDRGRYWSFAKHALEAEGDIDILFLGHSAIETGINPNLVMQSLERQLGRAVTVYVAAHPFVNPALDYMLLAEVLKKRRVKQVFLSRNKNAVFDYSTDMVEESYPWDAQLHWPLLTKMEPAHWVPIYMKSMTLGLRTLLSKVVDDLPPLHQACRNRESYLGACMGQQNNKELEGQMPTPPVVPAERLVHTRGAGGGVLIEVGTYGTDDRHISDAIFQLAADHGTEVALLQVPTSCEAMSQVPEGGCKEDRRWRMKNVAVPKLGKTQIGASAPVLGVAIEDLFPGMTLAQVRDKFYDPYHFHYAAAAYFTTVMLPGIEAVFLRTDEAAGSEPAWAEPVVESR